MKESFLILTAPAPKRQHHETKVTIDWTDITEEQMKILARGFIVYCEQCKMRKEGKIPEAISILAVDLAHPYIPMTCTYEIPPASRGGAFSKTGTAVDNVLANMSEEDRQSLLAMFA